MFCFVIELEKVGKQYRIQIKQHLSNIPLSDSSLSLSYFVTICLRSVKCLIGIHCRKKIGDVQIVSEQVLIICRSLGIRNAQFVGY
jgi:hypothetical protein